MKEPFPSRVRIAVFAAFLFLIMLRPGVLPALETTTITVGGVGMTVEVADDQYERSLGLMHREFLPADGGMLFVFPDEVVRIFWMKNTSIPLSIAFADARGVIIAIMDMVPDDGRTHYRSPGPAKYALEVNRGWFGKKRVRVGDRIIISGR